MFSKKLFLQKWRFLSFLAKYVPKGFSSIFEGSKSVKNGHFWWKKVEKVLKNVKMTVLALLKNSEGNNRVPIL